MAGEFQGDSVGAGCAVERSVVNFVGSQMIGVVIADKTLGETVELVGSVEVHATDLNRLVSGGSKGVCEGWNA